MGEFLNMDTSTKNNPNENYAREIMQLFSIGTDLLSQDGTTQDDVNGPLPTYDQSVIDNLKKVFTGWFVDQVPCDRDQRRRAVRRLVAAMRYDAEQPRHRAKTLFAALCTGRPRSSSRRARAATRT